MSRSLSLSFWHTCVCNEGKLDKNVKNIYMYVTVRQHNNMGWDGGSSN